MHRFVVRSVAVVGLVLSGFRVLEACDATRTVSLSLDERNRTVGVPVGGELQINLGTVGPGEYASPPQISSPVVEFLGVSIVPPYVPAGPRQLFRFHAVSRGTAIISFQHTGSGQPVRDTVEVH